MITQVSSEVKAKDKSEEKKNETNNSKNKMSEKDELGVEQSKESNRCKLDGQLEKRHMRKKQEKIKIKRRKSELIEKRKHVSK